MMLMWAFGSNLNLRQMMHRCPGARPLGSYYLTNTQLVFRGVADVVHRVGDPCPGGLWEITEANERDLDAYEGVSSGLYRKIFLKMRFKKTGKIRRCLVYQMMERGVMPPSKHYLSVIRQGYEDFGLDQDYLEEAVRKSWEDKALTSRLVRRRGKIKRARIPEPDPRFLWPQEFPE